MRLLRCVSVVTLTAALLSALAPAVMAQAAECGEFNGSQQESRICNAAVDGTRAFHPVAGLLVSGGNPVIGSGDALGGLGHFSLTARVNGVNVVFPDLDYMGEQDTVPAQDELFAPAPLVEGAVGIWDGLAGGLLAVDLLGSAQLLPTDQIDDLRIEDDARRIGSIALGFGFGARVGVLSERGPLPAVSVSVMRRNIPQLIYGDVDAGDQYTYSVDLHATNLRVVASKKVSILGLAAGLGWDKYTGDAGVLFREPSLLGNGDIRSLGIDLDNSRIMGFVNAGFDFNAVKLIGEAGYQGGRDQRLTTDFEGIDTESGKFFAGIGLRVGI